MTITRAGILDTVQDCGRTGYRHLGGNPSGAMDLFSAQLANALVGKNLCDPVIELHFPASEFHIDSPAVFVITGADLSATINGQSIPVGHPIATSEGLLKFNRRIRGARAYLSFANPLEIEPWLNSYSTNLKVAAGGFNGRKLMAGDELSFEQLNKTFDPAVLLPWHYNIPEATSHIVRIITGSEWQLLTAPAKEMILDQRFTITGSSDRMGFRLHGEPIYWNGPEMVSSPVTFGTVQLLPDGQLIVLMADHQTTGGYPRIGHIASVDLPILAQMNPGDAISFTLIQQSVAEDLLVKQQNHLQQLQNTCKLKMQSFLNDH